MAPSLTVTTRIFQDFIASVFKQCEKATTMTLSPCIKPQTLKPFRIEAMNTFAVVFVSHKKHY